VCQIAAKDATMLHEPVRLPEESDLKLRFAILQAASLQISS
jgi:hypothetical protein